MWHELSLSQRKKATSCLFNPHGDCTEPYVLPKQIHAHVSPSLCRLYEFLSTQECSCLSSAHSWSTLETICHKEEISCQNADLQDTCLWSLSINSHQTTKAQACSTAWPPWTAFQQLSRSSSILGTAQEIINRVNTFPGFGVDSEPTKLPLWVRKCTTHEILPATSRYRT